MKPKQASFIVSRRRKKMRSLVEEAVSKILELTDDAKQDEETNDSVLLEEGPRLTLNHRFQIRDWDDWSMTSSYPWEEVFKQGLQDEVAMKVKATFKALGWKKVIFSLQYDGNPPPAADNESGRFDALVELKCSMR